MPIKPEKDTKMEYKGKLYGKVGGVYFPLEATTNDFEALEKRVKELEAENIALKQASKPAGNLLVCNKCGKEHELEGVIMCPKCLNEYYEQLGS